VELGQVFSKYFGFPCQSSFNQILHHHNHPGQATIGQSVAAMPSGPSGTLPSTKQIKKKEVQPHYQQLEGISCPLYGPSRINPRDYTGRVLGPRNWSVPPKPFGKVLFRESHRKAPVWRNTILLTENASLKVRHHCASVKSFTNHLKCVSVY
jgi:hypothetical protein